MDYENLGKDDKKIDVLEKFFSDKIYYENCYRMRRHNQIIEAKTEARKEKRAKQRKEKREQAIKDNISVNLIKESVKDDIEFI